MLSFRAILATSIWPWTGVSARFFKWPASHTGTDRDGAYVLFHFSQAWSNPTRRGWRAVT